MRRSEALKLYFSKFPKLKVYEKAENRHFQLASLDCQNFIGKYCYELRTAKFKVIVI